MDKTIEQQVGVLVTYEQAKLLKEFGFDWECNYWYHPADESLYESGDFYNHNSSETVYSAPTLSQVQKWIYDKFGWWIIPLMVEGNKFIFDITDKYVEPVDQSFESFDTPFIALSKGIDKALELLKEELQ